MKCSIFSIDGISEEIYNIPEEGIEHVNCLKSKLSNYKHSFNSLNAINDRIKESSKIKMPKQMNIKKMIASTEAQFSRRSINFI